MHEAAAIQGALSEALAHVSTTGGTRIKRVTLVLGASGHFTEDVARQHFALNAQGTPAEGAVLDIEWLPASYRCFQCLYTFASAQPPTEVSCPACGGIALEIDHSDVCYICEIEVDESPVVSAFSAPEPVHFGDEQS
jgi:hydrogenase nickel incorporation protein HypA/HybF